MDRNPAYVADMLGAAQEVVAMLDGLLLSQFLGDRMRCLAVEKLFINLGEAASRVDASQAVVMPEIPWRKIIGLRNILAHGYEQVDHEVLYRTVTDDLPDLVEALSRWLASHPPN